MAALPVCGHCGRPESPERGCFWRDVWYCSDVCRHAAGDRSGCGGWDCGCTQYAKKRRLLCNHRVQMRVMQDLIDDHDLQSECEEAIIAETGNTGFWLGHDTGPGGLDEESDCEDPEAAAKHEASQLRQEAADRRGLVAAVQGALECRAITRDLERARMQSEDYRAQLCRK
jgi:hypothetical protein